MNLRLWACDKLLLHNFSSAKIVTYRTCQYEAFNIEIIHNTFNIEMINNTFKPENCGRHLAVVSFKFICMIQML